MPSSQRRPPVALRADKTLGRRLGGCRKTCATMTVNGEARCNGAFCEARQTLISRASCLPAYMGSSKG
eukprot:6193706-Pleurochrysis_carterae.AAC.1